MGGVSMIQQHLASPRHGTGCSGPLDTISFHIRLNTRCEEADYLTPRVIKNDYSRLGGDHEDFAAPCGLPPTHPADERLCRQTRRNFHLHNRYRGRCTGSSVYRVRNTTGAFIRCLSKNLTMPMEIGCEHACG